MTVVILIAVPEGLRGHLTRCLVEVSAGVFVGKMNQPLRNRIWPLLEARVGDGQAIMIEPANNATQGSTHRRPRPLAPHRLRRTDTLRPASPIAPQVNKRRPRTRGGRS